MPVASPRADKFRFDGLPTGFFGGEHAPLKDWQIKEWLTRVAVVVNNIMDGKINATGEVTLTASQATTILSDLRIGPKSVIAFMPTTANAAAEIGDGGLYVSARGKQTATLTHANNAQADRTFGYVILG